MAWHATAKGISTEVGRYIGTELSGQLIGWARDLDVVHLAVVPVQRLERVTPVDQHGVGGDTATVAA